MARVALVQNGYYEALGVAYLAAVLRQRGYEVELFLGDSVPRVLREVRRFDPDLLAMSCTTGFHGWYLELAAAYKARCPSTTVLLGGPHATFFPEIVEQPGVDAICRGEGEGAMADAAAAVDRGDPLDDIANLWVKTADGAIVRNAPRPLIGDLDALPFPDWSIYYDKYPSLKKRRLYAFSQRGCPYRCTYCFNHAAQDLYAGHEPYVRRRSVDDVIAEIEHTDRTWGPFQSVYFYDDTFNLDKRWIRRFCEAFGARTDLRLVCVLGAQLVDEAVVDALARARCSHVYFAIESGDEALRCDVLRKKLRDRDIRRTARLLRAAGIEYKTLNMIGVPTESIEQALATMDLNVEVGARFPYCTLFQPYPRTDLGRLAVELGQFDGDFDRLGRSLQAELGSSRPDGHQFRNLHHLFFYGVRFPRLRPLIRRAIRMRNPWPARLLFYPSYFYSYAAFEELRAGEAVELGLRNLRAFFDR